MSTKVYDYGIVGAGAAGLQLALAFAIDPFFDNKNILIIDKNNKSENDRTWCFWEKGEGKYDQIIHHSWKEGKFINSKEALTLHLKPYSYKKLNSLSFYNYAKKIIKQKDNIEWVTNEVTDIKIQNNSVNIIDGSHSYSVNHCFDSRIDSGFFQNDDRCIRILQHFKGWSVIFENDVFDPDCFTMMDFRLQHEKGTSFSYVLPVSKNEALVEFTLFTKDLLPDEVYVQYLKEYISNYISKGKYQIIEVEQGVIPMTNYPFHKSNSEKITKIGTAGSWVRPSTGYSFKYAEKNSKLILENLKANRKPDHNLIDSKFRMYDTLLLDILLRKNHLGPEIFYQMYTKNPVQKILKFLDGETSFSEDFKIISSLDSKHFLIAILNQLKAKLGI
jgi:lycopene beta-cyclase